MATFPDPVKDNPRSTSESVRTAVLAGGCFWCVEGVYQQLQGVLRVTSGYAGGTAEAADYQTVCTGATNHAEAVKIEFDPRMITYGQLLKVFFAVAHDPTQLDRQGNDVGRQYRSAIFYAGEEQRRIAESYIRQIDEAKIFPSPIVTRLEPLEAFYEAEAYHQDYAARNPNQPYIVCVALPKMKKLREYFPERIRNR